MTHDDCAAGYWYIVTARSTASFFPPATVFLRLVWVRHSTSTTL